MEFTDAIILPVIVGLVFILKGFNVPNWALPIASLTFGVIAGIVYLYPEDPKTAVFVGITMGLTASGAYSGTKVIIKEYKDKESDSNG